MGIGRCQPCARPWTVPASGSRDIDLFELNEAFAAQSVAVVRANSGSTPKVNVNSGAIALGHPIGASGARVSRRCSTPSVHVQRYGVASLCVGGGMGIAMVVERL